MNRLYEAGIEVQDFLKEKQWKQLEPLCEAKSDLSILERLTDIMKRDYE